MTTPGKRSRTCSICGTIVPSPDTRCPKHPKNTISARPHRRTRAQLLSEETHCWICGKPPTPTDPLTYDHIISRANGGDNSRANARAAHRSCNSRRGATRIPCDNCPTPTRCDNLKRCQPPSDQLDRNQRIRTARINKQTLPQHGPGRTLRNPPDLSHLPTRQAILVLCGPIASGKTTLAPTLAPNVISIDNIRRTLGPISDRTTLAQGYQLAYEETTRHLQQGHLVAFDSTAVTTTIRQSLLLRAQAARATAHLIMLDTPTHVARQRNNERDHPVPPDIVDQIQHAYWASHSCIQSEPWDTVTILGHGDELLQA